MSRRTSTWLLLASLVLAGYGCGAGVIPPVRNDAERLAAARTLAAKGKYSTAIDLLKIYVAGNAGSTDVDEAIYLLGECYLKMKDWPAAAVEFERLLRDYPESDSSGAAAFRLGEAQFGQTRPPDFDQEYTYKALEQWRNYMSNYPGHWLNAEAEKRIAATQKRLATKHMNTARLYLRLKLPGPARIYYQRVVEEYGDFTGEAMLGIALSYAMEGKNAEAIQSFSDVERRFPGQPIAWRAKRERSRLEH